MNFQYLYNGIFRSTPRFEHCIFCKMPCLLWEYVLFFLEGYPLSDLNQLLDLLPECTNEIPEEFYTLILKLLNYVIPLDYMIPAIINESQTYSLFNCMINGLLVKQNFISTGEKKKIVLNIMDVFIN